MDLKTILSNLQKECDKLYGEYGATEEIIQLQVAINTLRNHFNIPDENNIVYENFVQ